MTPERPGSIPLIPIIRECYSGEYTQDEMEYRVFHGGGIKAYLGTSDLQEVEERADAGDISAQLMLEAYAYQVAKEIGAMAAVLNGDVDAVILTGGAAFSPTLSALVTGRVRGLAKEVAVYPGESELDALAEGAYAYLRGDEPLINYDELPERSNFWQQVLEKEKSHREAHGKTAADVREAQKICA